MPQPCKNHAACLAYRRCYRCREYICRECASLAFHHYFCGATCTTLFFLSTIPGKCKRLIRLMAEKLIAEKSPPSENVMTVRRSVLLIVLTINGVFLIAAAVYIRGLNDRLARIQAGIQQRSTGMHTPSPGPANGTQIVSIPVLDSLPPATVSARKITLSGKADSQYVVSLSVNGGVQSAVIPHEGSFIFRDIPLQRGHNSLVIKALTPGNTVLLMGEIPVTYRPMSRGELSHNVRRGDRSLPKIALTFDGGSNDNNARQILDILREKTVRSTIFLTGTFIKKFPETAQRIAADGHEVGNHLFTHRHLTTYETNFHQDTLPDVTFDSLRRELEMTDSLYRAVTGSRLAKYWRAPFGEHNQELREWAAEAGYQHISWTTGRDPGENLDTHDWVSDRASGLYESPGEMRDKLLGFGKHAPDGANGAIILMHLGSNRDRDFLYEVLPEIIDGFRREGYTLTTVSDILGGKERIASR